MSERIPTTPEAQKATFTPGSEIAVTRTNGNIESGWMVMDSLDDLVTVQKESADGEVLMKTMHADKLRASQEAAEIQSRSEISTLDTDEGRAREAFLDEHYGFTPDTLSPDERLEATQMSFFAQRVGGDVGQFSALYSTAGINRDTGMYKLRNDDTNEVVYRHISQLEKASQDALRHEYEAKQRRANRAGRLATAAVTRALR